MTEQVKNPTGDPTPRPFEPFVSYADPAVPTVLYTFVNVDGKEVVRLANFVPEELEVIARGRMLLDRLRNESGKDSRFRLHEDFRMPGDGKLIDRTPSILQIRAVGLAAESKIRGIGVSALEQSSAAQTLYELRRTLDPFMERPQGDPEPSNPDYNGYVLRKLNSVVKPGWS